MNVLIRKTTLKKRNIMEQNTNQQAPEQQQPQNDQKQGFDFAKIPMKEKVLAGLGLLGAVSTFLPLTKPIPFFGAPKIISAFEGVIALILYLGLIALSLFGDQIKLEEKLKNGLPSYIGYAVGGLAVILLLRMLSNSVPMSFMGIGFYLFVLVGVVTALIASNVIKLK